MSKLPIIRYKGKKHYVDFNLEELREVKTAKQTKFTSLRGGSNSRIKKKLRALRARTWRNEYIKGLDD